jgi:hypothetical protein
MRGLAIGAIIASSLITGCGGAARSTTTPTSTTASASNPNAGSGYPSQFKEGFISSCIEGNTGRACGCMLATIESRVTYATVVEQFQNSSFIASPEYHLALRTCHGH